MAANRKAGRASVLEYQTDGAGGSAGWTTVTLKRDCTVTSEWSEADLSGSEVVSVYGAAYLDYTIEAELVTDADDAGYVAIQAAHEAGTSLGFRALSESGNAGAGPVFDGIVTRFNMTMNREGGQTTSITIRPAPSSTAPTWKDPT